MYGVRTNRETGVTRCVFYVAAIGRRQFEGVLSGDGPYIDCGNDGVAFGTCASIEQLGAEIEFGLRGRPAMPHNWPRDDAHNPQKPPCLLLSVMTTSPTIFVTTEQPGPFIGRYVIQDTTLSAN